MISIIIELYNLFFYLIYAKNEYIILVLLYYE
uniref:Uncharacterized protein n=1 Tax=viral metagenome TaxID=1070528 RepID=A0A6C0J0A9_9ZZZZ